MLWFSPHWNFPHVVCLSMTFLLEAGWRIISALIWWMLLIVAIVVYWYETGREILESMRRPSKFKFVYVFVCFYTLCVTIPSAVAVYWAYGDVLLTRSNAFAVLPPSGWRTVAIASMVVHQVWIPLLTHDYRYGSRRFWSFGLVGVKQLNWSQCYQFRSNHINLDLTAWCQQTIHISKE